MCLWSLFLTINLLKNLRPQELPSVGAAHSAWSGPVLTANWQPTQTSSDQGLIPFVRLYVVPHFPQKTGDSCILRLSVRACVCMWGAVVCYACTSVCIGTHIGNACMHGSQRLALEIFFYIVAQYFLGQVILLNLMLLDSPRLASQQASGTLLSAPPPPMGLQIYPARPAFYWDGIQTQVLRITQQMLYQLSQPPCPGFCSFFFFLD